MTPTSKPYLILVGIDYSSVSERALERAIEIVAAHSNAELHVVHVIPTLQAPPRDTIQTQTTPSPVLESDAMEQLRTYVGVSLGAFEKKFGTVPPGSIRVISHLRSDAPAHEIAQLAADLEADLVVVGMHGSGAIMRFFLGSVAEAVTRLAPCPVLVFRPKGVPPDYPKIEPPCPRCVDARFASSGQEYWCEQHRERHGQRNVYSQQNLMSQDTNLPLVLHTPEA